MSTVIDQKVVEMRFDNSHFEKNTKESMSTLEKLKSKLNLSGASKGLEDLNKSANKVNMNGLSSALDTVNSRFSAMEVIGVTALANITNSAVNAGKRMLKALTIDPVTTGFREYELKMDSVKTIMASTGEDIATVNKYLEELNEYSDQTIYSFSDMTQNIGKFTNAGVGLEDAVMAIKGISNEAAVSGANANEAARAMYNFAQALSSGYVKLIDWKSIENANMATVEFKQELIDSAVALGTVVEVADGMYETLSGKTFNATQGFNDVLQEQWMTSEVLVETLKRYADETTDIGRKAKAAAQDVTKLTQVFDIAKEVAQSGWAKTWELIFGDLEQAKKIFTRFSETITDIQMFFIDMRNDFLEAVLSANPFTLMLKKLEDSSIGTVAKKVTNISKSLEYYQTMVNKVWNGDYLNQPYRFGILANEGHDYRVIQTLVDLGYKHKITVEEVAAAEKRFGYTVEEVEEEVQNLSNTITELTDAQLKEMGLTEDEIVLYRQLEKESKRTGKSIDELVKDMQKTPGRVYLMDALANSGNAVLKVFKAIGEAWSYVYEPINPIPIYNALKAFEHLTSKLVMSEKTFDKVVRTLRGLFSILGFITDIIGGGLKVAFKIFNAILKTTFKLLGFSVDNILDYTAAIGDAIYNARKWVKEHSLINKAIETLVPLVISGVKALARWIANNELIQKGLNKVKNTLLAFKDAYLKWFEGLKQADNIPKYILEGLANGLLNGVKFIINIMKNLGSILIDTICKVLGIHSPSTVFMAIGGFIVAGLLFGLKDKIPLVWDFIKKAGTTCADILKKIDFGKIFAAAIGIGMLVTLSKLLDFMNNLTAGFAGFGSMMDGIGDGVRAFGQGLKAKMVGESIKSIAISIGILAVSILLLSKISPGVMWSCVGAIVAMTAVIGGLALAAGYMDKGKLGDFGKSSLSLISIATSLILLAFTLRTLGKMSMSEMEVAIVGLTALILALVTVIFAMGTLTNDKVVANIDKVGKMIKKISTALLMMVIVIKIVSWLDLGEIIKGGLFVVAFGVMIASLIKITKTNGTHADKIGKMLSKISFALLILVAVVKLAGNLSLNELLKGLSFVLVLGIFMKALIKSAKYSGSNAAKVGWMMLLLSTSLLTIVAVMKIMGKMDTNDLTKGTAAILALGVLMRALIKITGSAGTESVKAGAMLLMVAGTLLILSGVIFILGKMDTSTVVKGTATVVALGVLLKALIKSTENARNVFKTVLAITAALAVLVISLIALSFIKSDRLMSAVVSLTIVMGALAALIASAKNMKSPKDLWKTLGLLVGVTALLALIIVGMCALKPKGAVSSATALSVLLVALAASMKILSTVNSSAMSAMGAMAVLALIVGELGLVLGLLQYLNIKPSLDTVIALSIMLLTMSGVLAILSSIGLVASAAYPAMGALAVLIVGLGALLVAIGALSEYWKDMEKFLDKGIPILEKIGYALGSFFGSIVEGFTSAVMNTLPKLGSCLTKFMNNAQGFINGAKNISADVLLGVGYISAAVIALAAADFIESILSFFSIGLDFVGMGTKLSEFMVNLEDFLRISKDVDPNAMKGVKAIAEAVLILASADMLDSIARFISFGSSNPLSDFAKEIPQLGTGLKDFIKNLGSFGKKQLEAVDYACKALVKISDAAEKIPDSGGLWALLAGDNKLGAFANQFDDLGTGFKNFITNIGTFGKKQFETVDYAGQALVAIADAADNIPNSGGFVSLFTGDNNLAAFANDVGYLGTGLRTFIRNIGTFDDTSLATAQAGAKILVSIADAVEHIPDPKAFFNFWDTDKLPYVAENLPILGDGLKKFMNKVSGFGEDSIASINAAGAALNAISNISSASLTLSMTGAGLKGFGEKVVEFVEAVSSITSESIKTAMSNINTIKTMATTIDLNDALSVAGLGAGLKSFGKTMVKDFIEILSGNDTATRKNIQDSVSYLFGLVKAAFSSSNEELIKNTIHTTVASIVAAFSGMFDTATIELNKVATDLAAVKDAFVAELTSYKFKTDVYNAGYNAAKGFYNGVCAAKEETRKAGTILGYSTLDGLTKSLDEHSPSKETYKIGDYAGQGFINALSDSVNKVYKTSSMVGDTARKGLSKAVSKIADIVNTDIDSQPTIRPVLDLSDVESGAGYLNSMFNNPSIGVMSNLNAISAGVNSRLQNGGNSDVISAINELSKNLGNVGGDTYNINGVTYDDGSNITNAVQTIVRAATVGRRV